MTRSAYRRAGIALAGPGLTVALTLGIACGASDEPSISEAEASTAVNTYLQTTLGLFTGTTEPQAFIDQYAPACREGVDATSLAIVAAFMQGLAPALQGIAIEAVDAGPLDFEDGDGGVLATPREPNALRVQVNGQFVPATEFFSDTGLVAIDEDELVEPLLLVREGDAVYLGDCEELRNLAGGLPGS